MPGRPPAFDIVVEDEEGRSVWRRLEGGPIAMALGILRLAPGEETVFTDTWDQKDARGEPVAPGTYRVRGGLAAEGHELESTPTELTILSD